MKIPVRRLLSTALVSATISGFAFSPQLPIYSSAECEGSLTPYPAIRYTIETPDTLEAVYISHVGRHGARYPAGSLHCLTLQKALKTADSLGTITPLGRDLQKLNDEVIKASEGRWGALDSLGMAEQRGIAKRMALTFPELFKDRGTVNALSSSSPRSMMSMYSFVHALDDHNSKMNYVTTTGPMNAPLMRPFDVDADYLKFRKDNVTGPVYDTYFNSVCPVAPIERVLGDNYPYESIEKKRDLAITEYYVLAGLRAMSMENQFEKYFSEEEMTALWSCFNLRQYLQRTATSVSTIPADIASQLVMNIVNKTDEAVLGVNPAVADLRFGHAETVMPLASLLKLPECYYITDNFYTVAREWTDFFVVPMAANVQFILFKSKKTGNFFLRTELNERIITLLPGDERMYIPWGEAREYMLSCIPEQIQ